jgi:hypothetical protein
MIEKFFKWICPKGKPVEITLISKSFSVPDAGDDKCLKCGAERKNHSNMDHLFKEN